MKVIRLLALAASFATAAWAQESHFDLTAVPDHLKHQRPVQLDGTVTGILTSNLVLRVIAEEFVSQGVTNYSYARVRYLESATSRNGSDPVRSGNFLGAGIPRRPVYRTNIVVLCGYSGWTNANKGDSIRLESVVIGPPISGVRHAYHTPAKKSKVLR